MRTLPDLKHKNINAYIFVGSHENMLELWLHKNCKGKTINVCDFDKLTSVINGMNENEELHYKTRSAWLSHQLTNIDNCDLFVVGIKTESELQELRYVCKKSQEYHVITENDDINKNDCEKKFLAKTSQMPKFEIRNEQSLNDMLSVLFLW